MELMLTWITSTGQTADDADVAGYNVADYFGPGAFTEAKELVAEGQADRARALLQSTYKGPDTDGIGLRWLIA